MFNPIRGYPTGCLFILDEDEMGRGLKAAYRTVSSQILSGMI